MSKFLNKRFEFLEPYVPGEQPVDMEYIKLNTNESPYEPSPEVLSAVNESEMLKLRLYPDPDCGTLRRALANHYGVLKENIFVSNGSDDILNFVFMAFCDCGAVFPDITYGFYKVFAALNGVAFETIPLKDDFSIDPADYYNAGKTVVIANPNAPTGRALTRDEVETIINHNSGNIVLIDEAYVDFGAESAVELTKKYDNLIVVMTYSKSRSMAGARLGFSIASAAITRDLDIIRFSTNPYNINRLTLVAGVAALESVDYYRNCCRCISETRRITVDALRALDFEVIPSKANFVFAAHKTIDGGRIYKELKRRGILVRHFESERISRYNRITVGKPVQMDALCQALRDII